MLRLPPSEKRVIRFAVGSEEAPTSFVWRLYTQGDYAYLNLIALPNSNFVMKFSMHESRWQLDVGRKRHHFEAEAWPDSPGSMRGPVVMFCHLPYTPTLTPDWLTFGTDIKWFPMPNEWDLAEFAVFVTNAERQDSPPPPSDDADSDDPSAPLLIGPLPLRDGREVWLRHLVQRIPDDRREGLLNLRESLRGVTFDTPASELRAMNVVFALREQWALVGMPVGLETLTTKGGTLRNGGCCSVRSLFFSHLSRRRWRMPRASGTSLIAKPSFSISALT